MTAATIAKPVPINLKLIAVRRLSEADRSEELGELAKATVIGDHDVPWIPDYPTECTLRTLLHPSLFRDGDDVAWAAFSEYHNSLLIAAGIDSGEIDWREYGAYTCPDPKDAAWWDALGEVDGWMNVLLHGHPEARARYIHTTQKAGA